MTEQKREIFSQNLFRNGSSGYREDEISLIDLWQIVVRRRVWIFACFIICVITGGLYTMLKHPVFESTTRIQIGQIADIGPIEDGNVICDILLSRYGKDVAEGIERELPVLKEASVSKATAQMLELTVEGNTPEESTALLRQIAEELIRKQHAIQKSNITSSEELIQSLQSQRELLQRELNRAQEIFETLKQRDSVQASLIMMERSRIATALFEIELKLPILIQKLNPPQTKPPAILEDIVAPTEPATPKKILIMLLSSLLGLMTGLMIAFVAEFFAKVRSG